MKTTVMHLRHAADGGGGADSVILNIATFINDKRFKLIFVYLTKRGSDISEISIALSDKGVKYLELPGRVFFDIKQFINIIKLIKQYNVKIVHSHDSKSDVYGFMLRILCPRLKLVSTVHGWLKRRLRSVLYAKLDKFLLKKYDLVIAVSENLKQIAENCGIQKTCLIHNSININKWHPGNGIRTEKGMETPFNVGFVGRISKEKGPLDFVQVAEKILKQDGGCEFLVAGKGPEYESMKKLAIQLGLKNKFHFYGKLDDLQLFSFYQRLDLLLLTSYTEGLPMVLLEASSMFVPVVATKVGGVSEIIIHNYNGLLAEAGNIDLLARHVLSIKKNPEMNGKFKKNGRSIVENRFSVENNIKKIENVYTQMMPP